MRLSLVLVGATLVAVLACLAYVWHEPLGVPVDVDIGKSSFVWRRQPATGATEIVGRDEVDFLAGLGYMHAMDRGLQMLLMRCVGSGRVCEMLRCDAPALMVDVQFRHMQLADGARKSFGFLGTAQQKLLSVYADGVNRYFEEHGRPLELIAATGGAFRLEPWHPADSLLMMRLMAWINLQEGQAKVERAILNILREDARWSNISSADARELPPKSQAKDLLQRVFAPLLDGADDAELMVALRHARETGRHVRDAANLNRHLKMVLSMSASNNWVISGNHTESGLPVMGCDPHLLVNQLPGFWYEVAASLHSSFMVGVTVPGVPAVVMGRNANLSWSFTFGMVDNTDLMVEEIASGKYRSNVSTWEPVTHVDHEIKRSRSGAPPLVLRAYRAGRALLDYVCAVSGDGAGGAEQFDECAATLPDGYYISSMWTSDSVVDPSVTAATVSAMLRLPSVFSVRQAQQQLHAVDLPGNWLLADTENNIGFQQTGISPIRAAGHTGLWPGLRYRHGWDGRMYPRSAMRSSYNPPEGFIVTANNDFNTADQLIVNFHMERMPARAARLQRVITRALRAAQPSGRLTSGQVHALSHTLSNEVFSQRSFRWMKLLGRHVKGTPLEGFGAQHTDANAAPAHLMHRIITQTHEHIFGHVYGTHMWTHSMRDFARLTRSYWDAALFEDKLPHYVPRVNAAAAIASALHGTQGKDDATPTTVVWNHILFGSLLPPFLSPFDRPHVVLRGCSDCLLTSLVFNNSITGKETALGISWSALMDLARADCIETAHPAGIRDRFYSSLYANRLSDWQAGVRRDVCASLSTNTIFGSLGAFTTRVQYDQSSLWDERKRPPR